MLPTINLARGGLSLLPFLNPSGVMVSSGSGSRVPSPARLSCRWVFRCGRAWFPPAVSPSRPRFPAAFPPGAGPARQGPFSAQEGSERSPAIVSMGSCGASGRRRPGVGAGGRCSPSYPLIGRCLERRQHRAGFVQPQGHPGKDRPQHWLPGVAPRAETRGTSAQQQTLRHMSRELGGF